MEDILSPDILIVSPKEEPHIQAVTQCLKDKYPNLIVFSLDTAILPQIVACEISLHYNKVELEIEKEQVVLSFNKLRSIWWWRPRPPTIDSNLQSLEHLRFAYQECCQMLEAFWYLTDCLWVNQPQRQEVAFNRVYQLHAAMGVGLQIPDTIVTNSPKSVMQFLEKHNYQIIYRQLIPLCPKTFLFTEEAINQLNNLTFAPLMFQEIVMPDAWLYIYVIGENILAFRAYQQMNGNKREATIRPYPLLEQIKPKISALMNQTGLFYALLKMVIDKKGNYIFLEMDPLASFLEIEQKTKVPLTENLAHLLARGKVKEGQRVWPTLPKARNITRE